MNGKAPQTLFDKIWARHVVADGPGGRALLYIDRHLLHEGSFQAFEQLRQSGRRVRRPEKAFATADHYVPTRNRPDGKMDDELRSKIDGLADNASRHGIVHFGLGEVETMDIPFGTSMFARTAMLFTGAGALILPLARGGPGWDETLRTLSPTLADLFGSGTTRFVLIAIWAVSALVSARLLVVERRWLVLVDVAVIGVVGSVVAPLVAFALWFGLWHGPRHIARLVEHELADGRRSSTTRQAWTATIRRAAPATLGAYATLAAVVGVVVGYGSSTGAVATAIVVLLALTAPHMIVVAAMDSAAHRRRRRIDTTINRPPRDSRVSVAG